MESMTSCRNDARATSDDDIVEVPFHTSATTNPSPRRDDGKQSNHAGLCFAPSQQAYNNHGSDRLRALRTMPFDNSIWIGNLDDLGSRVWPHPSFNELLARSLTGDPRFSLPDTVSKDDGLQDLRLRCCGDSCSPTSQSPFLEYERPSRLEMLSFERSQNVVIYPFHVRLSKATGLQKLFAIVRRHENGDHKFWRADGTYHESYGLAKGSISVFQNSKSARSTNIGSLASMKRPLAAPPIKSAQSKAEVFENVDNVDDVPLCLVQKTRALTRSRNTEAQLSGGLEEDSVESPSKRRALADPSSEPLVQNSKRVRSFHTPTPAPQATSNKIRATGIFDTPTKQSGHAKNQRPSRSLLHVSEVGMLAYHLTGEGLKLLHKATAFTIVSAEGSLIDPTTDRPFEITEQHAMFVLSSCQNSFKVILSETATWSIFESPNDITGGLILLDFDSESARDEFLARIKQMVGMVVGGIGDVDDHVLESMYRTLLKHLNNCRAAMSGNQTQTELASLTSVEQSQSLPEEGSSKSDGQEDGCCPASVVKAAPHPDPRTPGGSKCDKLPLTPMSLESSSFGRPTATMDVCSMPKLVTASSTGSLYNQAREKQAVASSSSEPSVSEIAMKKEMLSLLRDIYVKYPSAQNDDQVENMALMLKAPLLAGNTERVKEVKMELKVYLIAHHG
ncbi:hypothetical protein E4T39_08680 [Aureobasidium subglaciale]|nr:hypothetical protein E4T39_08680 [Aureobasidium subglaciale]